MYYPPLQKPTSKHVALLLCNVILLWVSSFDGVHAQTEQVYFGSHTLHATQLCKQGAYDEAMEQIELAIRDSVDSSDFFTWYSRGFIYKEVYKQREAQNTKSEYREIAVASFLKSRKMAGSISERTDNHDLALKYLANTYYNDALHSTLVLTENDVPEESGYLLRYCEIMQAVGLDEECPLAYAAYYRACGQRFHEIWTADEKKQQCWERALKYYSQAIELTPNDCSLTYNITALYCNLLVTQRNQGALSSSGLTAKLMQESEVWLESSRKSCQSNSEYTELIKQAEGILLQLKKENSSGNQPSKN